MKKTIQAIMYTLLFCTMTSSASGAWCDVTAILAGWNPLKRAQQEEGIDVKLQEIEQSRIAYVRRLHSGERLESIKVKGAVQVLALLDATSVVAGHGPLVAEAILKTASPARDELMAFAKTLGAKRWLRRRSFDRKRALSAIELIYIIHAKARLLNLSEDAKDLSRALDDGLALNSNTNSGTLVPEPELVEMLRHRTEAALLSKSIGDALVDLNIVSQPGVWERFASKHPYMNTALINIALSPVMMYATNMALNKFADSPIDLPLYTYFIPFYFPQIRSQALPDELDDLARHGFVAALNRYYVRTLRTLNHYRKSLDTLYLWSTNLYISMMTVSFGLFLNQIAPLSYSVYLHANVSNDKQLITRALHTLEDERLALGMLNGWAEAELHTQFTQGTSITPQTMDLAEKILERVRSGPKVNATEILEQFRNDMAKPDVNAAFIRAYAEQAVVNFYETDFTEIKTSTFN